MKMTRTETPYSYEHANESVTTVGGVEFLVWDNYMTRQTVAQRNEMPFEVRTIKYSGYISNDLTARKAIQSAFGLDTFRK